MQCSFTYYFLMVEMSFRSGEFSQILAGSYQLNVESYIVRTKIMVLVYNFVPNLLIWFCNIINHIKFIAINMFHMHCFSATAVV